MTDSHSVSPHPRLPDSPEDLLEELPHGRAEEETLSNAEIHQENKRRVQVQVVSRTSEKAPPEGLVEDLPMRRAEEESPSNTKFPIGSKTHINSTQHGLIPTVFSLLSWQVTSGLTENDWIVDRRYNSSSEDEDSPGHSITITALVHAEACVTDSED